MFFSFLLDLLNTPSFSNDWHSPAVKFLFTQYEHGGPPLHSPFLALMHGGHFGLLSSAALPFEEGVHNVVEDCDETACLYWDDGALEAANELKVET